MNTSINRTRIIGVLLAGSFVTILNQTLLLVAIPPIMDDFGIAPNLGQWLTTAFLLMNGILIPVSAFLIEKFSSKSLLITALAIFSFGTFLGAVAPSFPVLLAARIIQAGGAGILMPLGQTVILTLYPPEKRGAAMGMVGLVIGFAPAIGPTLSGWVLDHFSWRHLFYIVLPVSLLVLLFSVIFMKNVTQQKEVDVDILSIVLSTLGWGGLLYGFSIAGSAGWGDPTVLASLAIGAAALTWFIYRQVHMQRPMLNFHVFQSGMFSVTTVLSVIVFALMIGIQTILPLYTLHVRGVSALETGLLLLPGAIIMGGMSPVTGKVFDKFGARGLAITGFALILLSTIFFYHLQLDTPILYLAIYFAVMMLGISMLMMPMMTAGINSLPHHVIAHGTAMNNTVRMVGGSIGTALLISIMGTASMNAATKNPVNAMLDGMHAAFLAAGVVAFVGLLLSVTLQQKTVKKSPA